MSILSPAVPTGIFCHNNDCILNIIAALVRFEFPSYSVNETDGSVEICVVVSNPTAEEILVFTIATQYEARSGTAGENVIIVRSI